MRKSTQKIAEKNLRKEKITREKLLSSWQYLAVKYNKVKNDPTLLQILKVIDTLLKVICLILKIRGSQLR